MLGVDSKKTKIVCTLGPAIDRVELVRDLIFFGMDVARLNFSHGSKDDHHRMASWVRQEAAKQQKTVALLQDLQGPKIRLGVLAEGTILKEGQTFVLLCTPEIGNDQHASVDEPNLWKWVSPQDVILLNDGLLSLLVQEVSPGRIVTQVVVGGLISTHKGVYAPSLRIQAGDLSKKDLDDLRTGYEIGVDFVALSFVRTAQDIRMAQAHIDSIWNDVDVKPGILAKIEKAEALQNLDEIFTEVTGIMVARGDLGVELGPEKVPLVQKDIIHRANSAGKWVITATEMLESMTRQARPTRAEASDVANALLDGTDAVMLSAETASGDFPVLAVQTMARIIAEIEKSALFRFAQKNIPQIRNASNAIAYGAFVAADWMRASCIVVWDPKEQVVKMLSDHRPWAPVLAVVPTERQARQYALHWGVQPLCLSVESLAQLRAWVQQNLDAVHRTIIAIVGEPSGYQLHIWE